MDIPAWQRFLLLNLVILPFRPRTSGEAYGKICTPYLHVVPPFHNHPAYIDACSRVMRPTLAAGGPTRCPSGSTALSERQCIKSDDTRAHCPAIVNLDGTPTALYPEVRRVNADVRAIGSRLLNS